MSKIKGAEELQHMEDVMQHVDAAVKRLLVSNDAIYKLISEDHEVIKHSLQHQYLLIHADENRSYCLWVEASSNLHAALVYYPDQ